MTPSPENRTQHRREHPQRHNAANPKRREFVSCQEPAPPEEATAEVSSFSAGFSSCSVGFTTHGVRSTTRCGGCTTPLTETSATSGPDAPSPWLAFKRAAPRQLTRTPSRASAAETVSTPLEFFSTRMEFACDFGSFDKFMVHFCQPQLSRQLELTQLVNHS